MNLLPGALVENRFRLRAEIGEGGMGTVWSAQREDDGRGVALKILKTDEMGSIQRVLREARIAQRMIHPNIVRVEEILTPFDSPPIIVMELLEGESLRERLVQMTTLPLGEAARILAEVTSAVSTAHGLGVVHRDLKPENVFLERVEGTAVPRAKVLDFGIAKVSAPGALHTAGMTRTGSVLGTPHYMAPEQVFGERDLDARADVWALGVIFFECLSGKRPFVGDNYGQIFKAITMSAPPPLASLCSDLPAEIPALVGAMLDSDRDARPSTDAILEVLRGHAEALVEPRTADAIAFRPGDAFAPTVATPLRLQADAGRRGERALRATPKIRRRWVGGLALVPLLASGALVVARRHSPPPVAISSGVTASSAAAVVPTVASMNDPPTSAAPGDRADPPRGAASTSAGDVPAGHPSRHPTSGPSVRAAVKATPTTEREPDRLPGGVHGVSPY